MATLAGYFTHKTLQGIVAHMKSRVDYKSKGGDVDVEEEGIGVGYHKGKLYIEPVYYKRDTHCNFYPLTFYIDIVQGLDSHAVSKIEPIIYQIIYAQNYPKDIRVKENLDEYLEREIGLHIPKTLCDVEFHKESGTQYYQVVNPVTRESVTLTNIYYSLKTNEIVFNSRSGKDIFRYHPIRLLTEGRTEYARKEFIRETYRQLDKERGRAVDAIFNHVGQEGDFSFSVGVSDRPSAGGVYFRVMDNGVPHKRVNGTITYVKRGQGWGYDFVYQKYNREGVPDTYVKDYFKPIRIYSFEEIIEHIKEEFYK